MSAGVQFESAPGGLGAAGRGRAGGLGHFNSSESPVGSGVDGPFSSSMPPDCLVSNTNNQPTNKTITVNKNSKCLLKARIPSIVMLAGSDK